MSTIDQATYRQVLGHFPTGVTVIAGMDGDEPVGLAVGSFFSLSLAPALVGFCVDRSSGSWARMVDSGSFSVNILGADQEDVCRVFATSGDDKFDGIGWKPAESGSPLIDGVLAWIDCAVEDVHDGGDHEIVVGRVLGLDVANEGSPLVFFRGGYANLK
ncbi:flavin reductase family protein [Acidimicrobiia bacterium EGI L10123]|uniref:flavin reductase family protein n=1 Tax=Salinilacustrithrix flava TaxID=2957203 RepID=UPI003D7C157E|nr:flavin reductase family protein [Acidimicrobiia bacterium EGI L10123]